MRSMSVTCAPGMNISFHTDYKSILYFERHFLYFCTSFTEQRRNKLINGYPLSLELNYYMEIASKYNPAEVENKWYQYWMEQKLFHSEPDEVLAMFLAEGLGFSIQAFGLVY